MALARSASVYVAAIATDIYSAAHLSRQPVKCDLIIIAKECDILERSIPASTRTYSIDTQ